MVEFLIVQHVLVVNLNFLIKEFKFIVSLADIYLLKIMGHHFQRYKIAFLGFCEIKLPYFDLRINNFNADDQGYEKVQEIL